jgi:hypothetical protein
LQGGTSNEYYHLTSAKYAKIDSVTIAASAINGITSSLATKLDKSDSTANSGYATRNDALLKSALNDSTKFLDSRNSYSNVHDADLVFTDVTTNNVSSSKHGLVPKTPNDSTKYLRGNGTWGTASGGSSPTLYRLASNASITSTTGQTLTGMSFSAGANKKYHIIFKGQASHPSAGTTVQISLPSGCTATYSINNYTEGAAVSFYVNPAITSTTNALMSSASAQTGYGHADITVVVGATAGTIAIQGLVASGTGTVYAGTEMVVQEIQ